MTEKKLKHKIIIIELSFFLVYAFLAAEPVPQETVLSAAWINSLESSYPEKVTSEKLIPFELGGRFGYVSKSGKFSINQFKKKYISMSEKLWAEYGAEDQTIDIKDPQGNQSFTITNANGYPFFIDSRIFVLHNEQYSISEFDKDGNVLWKYDFASPIICADAAAGLLLTGSLDGTIDLLNSNGERIFFSEPSGSRISAIFGCALSRDGTRIAAISGLDKQRFIYIEQVESAWRITHHKFLDDGFRRPALIRFVDNDNRIVFENQRGLGIYDIKQRKDYSIDLSGTVEEIDEFGVDNFLFVLMSVDDQKKNLAAIRYPDYNAMIAPFKSGTSFISRDSDTLFIGGGSTLAAFKIEKK